MSFIDVNLVLVIVAVTWHYALFCGYVSDDHAAVAGRMDIIPDSEKVNRGESFWVKRFNDGIVMFYHTAFFRWLGFADVPLPWHLFSLSLHILNVYLLYLFILPISGHDVAIATSAIWAVNPMINQNVVWVSGRPYLFGLFFGLISLICWQHPDVFAPYYVLSVITNISTIFVPIIFWALHPKDWQSYFLFIVTVALVFPFMLWKFQQRFGAHSNALILDRGNAKFKIRKINVFARMIFYYLTALITGDKMGWYHQEGFKYNEKWELFNYKTFIGYALAMFGMIFFPIQTLIFILGLFPMSNLFATNSFLQDRYVYFCSIGFAWIIAPILVKYPPVFFILITYWVTCAYRYSKVLKDDETLYRENWRNHPNSDFAINNLSYFLIQQRRFDEARVYIERGLDICKDNRMLWYNLGITYAAQGHFHNDVGKYKFIRALECFKTCVALEPRWTKPVNDLKRLIQLLIDNKVLSLTPDPNNPHGMSITLPNLIGLKEDMSGTNPNDTAETAQKAESAQEIIAST
jgi:tetratricopeptide (TPR) repeat protein